MPMLNIQACPTDKAMMIKSLSAKLLQNLTAVIILIGLSGCGQKGPLVMPQASEAQVKTIQNEPSKKHITAKKQTDKTY